MPSEQTRFASATRQVELRIHDWVHVDDLPQPIAQFETVFWEPRDTESLRKLIRETDLKGRTVLEIGTGTGLIALCCLQAGAKRVVATDVNPAAVANALYNADLLGLADRLEVRQVPLDNPAAFAVVADDERFDLILSNPPWEDANPDDIAQYALYDPGFQLLQSLVDGLPKHLEPGGRTLLAYGCVDAIRTLEHLATEPGQSDGDGIPDRGSISLVLRIHDDRPLDSLPNVFLPGMLIELEIGSQ